jgi:hypothetical protein
MDRYGTQWAAQFYVAAELTRRGFLVSFTMGNAKRTDLLVTSPGGHSFTVQVKGAKTKAGWWAREPQASDEHFYLFVHIEPYQKDGKEQPPANPRFFIMKSEEVQKLVSQEKKDYEHKHHEPRKNEGLSWGDVLAHENKWEKLPS